MERCACAIPDSAICPLPSAAVPVTGADALSPVVRVMAMADGKTGIL